jgi:membrane protease YdiL (CAAX protease family)
VQGFYFCLTCATPYKSVETLLPVVPKVYEGEGTLIARKAPHVWSVFWTYFAVVVGSGILSLFLSFDSSSRDLAFILGSAVFLVATCVLGSLHWSSLWVQFKRLGFLHPAAWIGVVALAPLLCANYGYSELLRYLMGEHDEQHLRSMGLPIEALVLFIAVLPAITEEIAFRGLVQHWLQVALTPRKALVIASALFMALHFNAIGAPYLFAVGMLLGWVKLKTGSLYPSMLIHFLHNFVVVVFFR